MRKVYLDEIPRWKTGANTGRFNWSESVGYRFKFIYDDIEGEIEILNYSDGYLTLKWKDRILEVFTSSLLKCCLGKLLGKLTDEFKIEIDSVLNNVKITKRKLVVKNYRGYKINKKYYKYTCNKCGFECGEYYKNGEYKEEHWVEEGGLLRGNGCACCSNHIVVPHINSIVANKETHWMIKYFQGGHDEAKKYTCNSGVAIYPICPDCGKIRDKLIQISTINTTHSIACSCGTGFKYPEKFMYSILKQLDVEFETQYSPDYLNRKLSDFHIPFSKLIIETDGKLGHKGGIAHSMSDKKIEECIEIDIWKDEQHNLHGLHTIRINCFKSNMEYIKNNILNSELVDYFNFEDVDWNEANEFAWFSNLKKDVCEYWNNKEDWETTKDLVKVFNVSQGVIVNYLTQGTKFNWCNYDSRKEVIKNASKSGKLKGKPVEIFKGDISLGVFPSCTELERQSEELFGVKLFQNKISQVCNRKIKHYKGYTFEYI